MGFRLSVQRELQEDIALEIPTYSPERIESGLKHVASEGQSFYVTRHTNIHDGILEIPAGKVLRFIEFGSQRGISTMKTTTSIEVFVQEWPNDLCHTDERIFTFLCEGGKVYKGKIKVVDDDTIKLKITGVLQGGKVEEMTGAFA